MSNSNYKKINVHGTPSSFEPHTIQSSLNSNGGTESKLPITNVGIIDSISFDGTTEDVLKYDNVIFDDDNIYDLNTGTFTIQKSGRYRISVTLCVNFDSNSTEDPKETGLFGSYIAFPSLEAVLNSTTGAFGTLKNASITVLPNRANPLYSMHNSNIFQLSTGDTFQVVYFTDDDAVGLIAGISEGQGPTLKQLTNCVVEYLGEY
jgi:hypothetical protein